MEIHPESARLFEVDEEVEKAKNAAFRLLSGRAYSRTEMLDKLKKRRFGSRAIEQVLSDLDRLGLVDDHSFARRFAEDRLRFRPMGRALLYRDLKRRKVAVEVIEPVLEEVLADVDALAMATELLRSRMKRYTGLPRSKAMARMCGFLGRRGFGPSDSQEAAREIWSEIGAQATPQHQGDLPEPGRTT